MAVQFPIDFQGAYLVTFSTSTRMRVVLETAQQPSKGQREEWVTVDSLVTGPFLNHFQNHAVNHSWIRLRFLHPTFAKIWNLGFYEPKSDARNDYWLALGASIQNQSMRQARFNPAVRRQHPRADPVLFNLGVRGWSSTDLLANLPALLERHPHADYALIHIGGNDISSARPYPGGSEILETNLDSILTLIEGAGIIPVLARVSYRRYQGEYPVPPESNGSEPYGRTIHDRVCQARMRDFFNSNTGRCSVDFYDWFRKHPDELAADGVHLNAKGEESWNRLWVEKAASVVYGLPLALRNHDSEVLRNRGRSVEFPVDRTLRGRPWTLKVWDIQGRLLREIGSNPPGEKGRMSDPNWDLKNQAGKPVTPGLFVYSLTYHVKQKKGKVRTGQIIVTP
jgi:lysophospholipase L1-like esterase